MFDENRFEASVRGINSIDRGEPHEKRQFFVKWSEQSPLKRVKCAGKHLYVDGLENCALHVGNEL